ncbi:MAG: STAS domain-containing protein [Planctomycetota bacterium]|jgi:anti-anti-sigma regulatory factor
METQVLDRGAVRVLKLSGHIASSEVDALIAEFNELKEVPGARCVLDMAVLKNLPTAIIGALIELIRHLETAGGRLVLAAPDATVRVPLDRLGVAPMVTITESTDEAVELLEAGDAPQE